MELSLVLAVVLIALVFEYINGFHDTANSIATVVATKVLSPAQAVLLAAGTNLLGALAGTAVAKTIASGLVDTGVVQVTSGVLICALAGATVWNLITWWWGLPSSSSHALVGGLCGAALAAAGDNWKAIIWNVPGGAHWWQGKGLVPKVILPMLTSPAAGFLLGIVIMGLFLALFSFLAARRGWLQKLGRPRFVNGFFAKAQIVSAAPWAGPTAPTTRRRPWASSPWRWPRPPPAAPWTACPTGWASCASTRTPPSPSRSPPGSRWPAPW